MIVIYAARLKIGGEVSREDAGVLLQARYVDSQATTGHSGVNDSCERRR